MKPFIKTVLASAFALVSTQSFAATETLRVAVIFDKNTINTVTDLDIEIENLKIQKLWEFQSFFIFSTLHSPLTVYTNKNS